MNHPITAVPSAPEPEQLARAPKITHNDLAAFAEERVNLRREDAEDFRNQVNNLRDKLERYASEHPVHGIVKSMLSGSLAKGTALKTLNDIDVAVYVKGEKTRANEADLLSWLADRLREAYPQMKPEQIRVNRHSVSVAFSGSGLKVDIVPIKYFGDPDWRGDLFTSDGGRIVTTSIPMHLAFIRRRKEKQKHNFAQMIRFIKWWAKLMEERNKEFRLKSFMTEMIIAHLLDTGIDMSDYPRAFEQIFTYIVKSSLKKRISFTDYYPAAKLPAPTGSAMEVFDPVNETNNVAAVYGEQNRRLIVASAEEALEEICQAHHATTRGQAIQCWQAVLGPSFRGDA